jgi:toxin-antitoxin system PIN domain toxin
VVILPDVNVLVAAYRDDAPDHGTCRSWLRATVEGDEPFALSELVLSGFLRVVTHPRVFTLPSTIGDALGFVDAVKSQHHCVSVAPGPRHSAIFTRLCRAAEAKGNLIPDAYLAALAIESGCEWVTLDRDYARFEGLRWRPPRS